MVRRRRAAHAHDGDAAVQAGLGVGLMPRFLAQPALTRGAGLAVPQSLTVRGYFFGYPQRSDARKRSSCSRPGSRPRRRAWARVECVCASPSHAAFMTETRAPLASRADIDAFIDAVWLEDACPPIRWRPIARPDRLRALAGRPESYARAMADRYGEAAGGQARCRAGQDAGAGRQADIKPGSRSATKRDPRGHGQPAAGGAAPLLPWALREHRRSAIPA